VVVFVASSFWDLMLFTDRKFALMAGNLSRCCAHGKFAEHEEISYAHGVTDRPGLRERKRQRTRETIARVALELFDERGYDATTLANIAEAAEVSPRTIFAYFPSKVDILFSEFPAIRDALEREVANRSAGKDVLETARDFVLSAAERPEIAEILRRRARIVEADETLRNHEQARLAQMEEVVAAAIARELGATASDLRPLLAAASLTAGFRLMTKSVSSSKSPRSPEQLAAMIDPIVTFVRGGLDALAPTRTRDAAAGGGRTRATSKTRAVAQKTSS